MAQLLYEANCEICELSFDVWVETDDETDQITSTPDTLACPGCLFPARDLREKDNLS